MTYSLTPSQEKAFEVLTKTNKNVFLSGYAGTGKSFLIQKFILTTLSKKFPILASTGAASVLVGGRTFHSFFGLGILEGGAQKTYEKAISDKGVQRRLRKIEGIVIDEVSMISSVEFEIAQKVARTVRKKNIPWGGLRVIVVGDFYQLPPVNPYAKEKEWCFLSEAWQSCQFEHLFLTDLIRYQNDEDFLKMLNLVREAKLDDFVMQYLNDHKVQSYDSENFEDTTVLLARRNQVDNFNLKKLNELEGEKIHYQTEYTGSQIAQNRMKKVAPIPEVITIKKNAFVMIRMNDPKERFVNGTTGFIREALDEVLLIELTHGKLIELNKFSFTLLDANGDELATAKNFPISMAYALTIHKSQGVSLDKAIMNLENLWECGQAYVALSRVRSGEGLKILGWHPKSFKTDSAVRAYYSQNQF